MDMAQVQKHNLAGYWSGIQIDVTQCLPTTPKGVD
jgi:hypothetical protein